MTGWRKVYCETTGVYLGCLWPDDLSGVVAENRRARARWFADEAQALAWLNVQVVRADVAAWTRSRNRPLNSCGGATNSSPG